MFSYEPDLMALARSEKRKKVDALLDTLSQKNKSDQGKHISGMMK